MTTLTTFCRGGLPCQVEIHYSRGDPFTGIPAGWEVDRILTTKGKIAYWIEPTEADYDRFEKEAEEQC